MNPAPSPGPQSDHLVETVTFQAAGIDEMERRLQEFNKLIDETVDGADEIGEVLKAAAASFVAPHRKSKSSNTSAMGGFAEPSTTVLTPMSPSRTKPSRLSEKRFDEAGLRLKEAQQEAPSKLVQSGIRSIEEQDKALVNAFTELDKLRRELSDGTFRKAATEMERYRQITANLARQQALLNSEARRQELQARYGNYLGGVEARRQSIESSPGFKMMIQRMDRLTSAMYAHGQAGLQGSVYDEQLKAQTGRLNKEIGSTLIGPTQIKSKLTGLAADQLQKLPPGAQDAIGWGLTLGQNAPGALANTASTALALLPGVGKAAGGALRMGARGLGALGSGGGLLAAGGFLAGGAFLASNMGDQAQRRIDRDEAAGKGDFAALGLKGDEFGYRERFNAIKDPIERKRAIREEQTKLTKEQTKDPYQPGFHRTVVDAVNDATSWGGKTLLGGLGMGVANKGIEDMFGKRNARRDDLQERQAVLQGIDKPLAKDEDKPKHKSLQIAAGGFEGSDDTYQRIEAAFSKQLGDQANQKDDQGMEGLTKAINGLVSYLQQIFGGGANQNQDKMLKGR